MTVNKERRRRREIAWARYRNRAVQLRAHRVTNGLVACFGSARHRGDAYYYVRHLQGPDRG